MDLRLAYHDVGKATDNALAANSPSLLVSFVYLKSFFKKRDGYNYRNWVMDSGAFTAHQKGKSIDLQEYMDTCKELMATDPKLVEVFALDVMYDWRASQKNYEKMWKAGIPAIPCYHLGEPKEVLIGLAKDYPKVAIGGVVGYKNKFQWAKSCFGLIWPKKIHGFGFGSVEAILNLPFHSADASNWEMGPAAYGRWAMFGDLRIHGSDQNLTSQVKYYLDLEKKARWRWKKEMALLDSQDNSPTLNLVDVGAGRTGRATKNL